MPFQSSAQERFMRSQHPDIAKRWTSEFGSFKGQKQNFKPSPKSESNETPKLGLKALPRVPANKRDYGMLTPDAKARHTYEKAATEQQYTAEAPVQAHTGSRPGKMSIREGTLLDSLAKRDVNLATRKKV